MSSDLQQARNIIRNDVLPIANKNINHRETVEYQIVDESQTTLNDLGFTEGTKVYIGPVNTETGDLVEDPSLLNEFMGNSGAAGEFQDHILDAFRQVASDSQEAADLFNIKAGQTYATVKLNPLLGGNI